MEAESPQQMDDYGEPKSIMRGLEAQPSINHDNCFAKVAGEALPDPDGLRRGHAQIIIIIIFFLSISYKPIKLSFDLTGDLPGHLFSPVPVMMTAFNFDHPNMIAGEFACGECMFLSAKNNGAGSSQPIDLIDDRFPVFASCRFQQVGLEIRFFGRRQQYRMPDAADKVFRKPVLNEGQDIGAKRIANQHNLVTLPFLSVPFQYAADLLRSLSGFLFMMEIGFGIETDHCVTLPVQILHQSS
jgi:hypothetical protein